VTANKKDQIKLPSQFNRMIVRCSVKHHLFHVVQETGEHAFKNRKHMQGPPTCRLLHLRVSSFFRLVASSCFFSSLGFQHFRVCCIFVFSASSGFVHLRVSSIFGFVASLVFRMFRFTHLWVSRIFVFFTALHEDGICA